MSKVRVQHASLILAVTLSAGLSSLVPGALANEVADAAMAKVKAEQGVDVKKIFGTQCGLCHGDYGMTMGGRGGGPKLAGTQLDHDGVKNRIRDGKSGMMPAFKKMLKEEDIDGLAVYIKSLPGGK